jgi:hypothetical protein
MHVFQAMVNVVGNNRRNAHFMFKTGISVSGNMEMKKRLTKNILSDMIFRAQNSVTSNIMIDFKSLCSTSLALQLGEGKFGGGVEVRQEQVSRNYRTAVQYLDLMEKGNTPANDRSC